MPFAIAAVVTAVVGAGIGVKQSIDQKHASEDAADVQENVVLSQRLSAQKQNTRARRIAAGRLKQQARNTGTSGSSGESGAMSSIASQFAANVGKGNFAVAVGDARESIASELRESTAFNQQASAVNSAVGTAAQVELATQDADGKNGAISTMFS